MNGLKPLCGLVTWLVLLLAWGQSGAHDQCVISNEEIRRQSQHLPHKVAQIGSGEWHGDVYVLAYDIGNPYDRDLGGVPNVEPRRWVTQSFFAENPDVYDFVVVLTNFEWDAGNARGLYWSIFNDVQGIGVGQFDSSLFWGSERIQGYIDGSVLSGFLHQDGTLDVTWVEQLLNHEIGHRWLAHPTFLDQGSLSEDLIGQDGSHWSFLLDSQASYMYGSEWTDNGDGTFTATAHRERYSELDLYLMGVLPPEEVSPFTLLVNPDIDPNQIPQPGATIVATPRTITIDDVIAAEGPRSPSAEETVHEFRVAMIYLVDPATPVSSADLEMIEQIRQEWERSFFVETRGRGLVDVGHHGNLPPGSTSVDLQSAISWLVGQGQNGTWEDSPATQVRDTVAAVAALDRVGGHGGIVEPAITHLGQAAPTSNELEARRLWALGRIGRLEPSNDVADLIALGNDGGGWSSFAGYAPDPVTTARVIRSAVASGRSNAAQEGWQWLVGLQNPDGGWGWQQGSPSSVAVTEEVLLAARELGPGFWDGAEVDAALQWLLGGRTEGGVGDGYANAAQTAVFLELLQDRRDVNQTIVQEAVDFVGARQLPDGSWGSSVHTTALAINALASFALPDPYVEGGQLFADPEDPFDDQTIDLVVAVRNAGLPLDAGTPYRWEARRVDLSGVTVWTDSGELPAVPDVGFVSVTTTIDPPLPAGQYELRFIIDPERSIAERDRMNDVGTQTLMVRSHPDGVDLALRTGDLIVDPETIAATPQPMTIAGVVRNLGLSDAPSTLLRAYAGDPADGVVLGETTVVVPALGLAPYSLPAIVPEPRSVVVTVVADPDRVIEDVDRFNNTVSRSVPLRDAVDLTIEAGGFTATPMTVSLGESQGLSVTVRNAGTVPISAAQVQLSYETGAPPTRHVIAVLTVDATIEPGDVAVVETSWNPNVAGEPLAVFATVDPTGSTGDEHPENNEAQLGVTVLPSDLPNLVVTPASLAFAPQPPLQGASCMVSATVSNPSANGSGAFEVELWLDAPGTGILLGSELVAALAAGESSTVQASWSVTEPDDRLVYVTVDPAGVVSEFNEDDNQAFVEVDVQTLPDLAVTSGGITWSPSFPHVGEAVSLEVLVANQGDQDAAPTALDLIADDGGVIDSVPVPALEAHSDVSLSLTWSPGAFVGDARLTLEVDGSDAVTELDEDNNSALAVIGVQDADLFVSDRVFSPNGDGVRDTTSIFFRNGAESIEIREVDGRTLRTLVPEPGAEAVVWDGRTDRGNLVSDGMYEVGVGGTATWVAVDINRFRITNDVDQRLLIGFVEPRVPGPERPRTWNPELNIERSWFISIIENPVSDEIFLVEQYHAEGTTFDEDTYSLWVFAGDELVKLGDLGAETVLHGVDAAGRTLLVFDEDVNRYGLLRMPELEFQQIDAYPSLYSGYYPSLSPDGRWLMWTSDYSATFGVESVDDLGNVIEFDDTSDVCSSSLIWTPQSNAVLSYAQYGGSGFFHRVDTSSVPVEATRHEAEGWYAGCGGDGKLASTGSGDDTSADEDQPRYVDPELLTGMDFDGELLTFLSEYGGGSGNYGGHRITAGVFNLADGSEVATSATDPFGMTWTSPIKTLSSDGRLASLQYIGVKSSPSELDEQQEAPIRDFLSADGPDRLVSLAQKNGSSPVDQYLYDWKRERIRGLPLSFREGFWTAPDTYFLSALRQAELHYDDMVPYLTPAANLKARVKPRVLFGDAGIDLWVLASDRYLDWYLLEYVDLNGDPELYHPIGLPSDEPLYGSNWGTWIPPGNGKYRIRLTAVDLAGNRRVYSHRVTWNGDNDIANLYTESRYLSPRASLGVQDELVFHYTVLRPANLRFTIVDADGVEVTEILVAADQIGPRTTTWDGTDNSGSPVPDGEYHLAYGEARWPAVVDNTPPVAQMQIQDTQYVRAVEVTRSGSVNECVDGGEDLWVNELRAAVRDLHIREWEYQVLEDEATQTWVPRAAGTDVLGEDAVVQMGVYGAGWVANRRLRMVARDLAGNETITESSFRDERIAFTESEPACRSAVEPCVFPDRPAIDELTDSAGLLVPEGPHTLSPYYDTLLVQSTVVTDELELRLQYREAGLGGLPPGPWVDGAIQVGESAVRRQFQTVDPPFDGTCPDEIKAVAMGDLIPVYWDHPELPQTPVEVRFAALNDDGVEVFADPILFYPEVALSLRHTGVDAAGDHFEITNLSPGVVRSVELQIRVEDVVGGLVVARWDSFRPVVDRLEPGATASFVTGCDLVEKGGRLLRAAGIGGLGPEATSAPVVVPDREGFATLSGATFLAGSCPHGSHEGSGLFGIERSQPCDHRSAPPWPVFWVSDGATEPIGGRVPVDPTGVDFLRYELLIDGQPQVTIDGPLQTATFQDALDMTGLAAGDHTLTERYTYAGQPGLLGQCERQVPLRIDRTPPIVSIAAPADRTVICPDDQQLTVELNDLDDTPGRRQMVFINDQVVGGSTDCGCPSCAPFGGGDGSSYTVSVRDVPPGVHQLRVQSVDRAGHASCDAIQIVVPDLPNLNLTALPEAFSPTNTLGRATVVEIRFTGGTPGSWQATIQATDGTVVQASTGTLEEADERVVLAWDGRDALGGPAPDGWYTATVTVTSPCGASETESVGFLLDTAGPVLSVHEPTAGVEFGLVLEAIGLTRDAENLFEAVALEVRSLIPGGSDEWRQVSYQDRPVIDEPAPLGVWSAAGFMPGNYLIRLRAWDEPGNETFSTEIPVEHVDRALLEFFDRQPEMISPNGDFTLDDVTIELEVQADAIVTLTVESGIQGTVATLMEEQFVPASAGATTITWDGRTDLGPVAGDGAYFVLVRAEDAATPPVAPQEIEILTLFLDTTPPELELTNPAEQALVGLDLDVIASHLESHPDDWRLTLLGEAVGPLTVGIGSGTFSASTVAVIGGALAPDGSYELKLEATDVAGNTDSLRRAFVVDNTAPQVSVIRPVAGVIVNTFDQPLHLDGTVEEDHLVQWEWSVAPGGNPQPADFTSIQTGTSVGSEDVVSLAWDASVLADGLYTIRLAATDELGRVGEDRRSIVVDNTPPALAIGQPADAAVIGEPIDILGSVADEHPASWTLTLVSGAGAPLQPPLAAGEDSVDGRLVAWNVLPEDGPYLLRLEAEDRAGNTGSTERAVVIQTTPPSPPVITSVDVVNRTDAVLVWQPGPGPEPVGYTVYRDGTLITPLPVTDRGLTDPGLTTGTYGYVVRGIDDAGEETEDSNRAEVEIDLRPPTAVLALPLDGTRVSDLVRVIGTADRANGFAGWRLWVRLLPSGNPVLIGSGTVPAITEQLAVWDTSLPAWSEGPYELLLEASDVFGNTAAAVAIVEVDNTAPVAPVLTWAQAQAADPDIVVNDVNVEWVLDPTPSDLAGFYLYRNGQLANAPGPVLGSTVPFLIDASPHVDKDLPDGTYVYSVSAADTAENESATSNESDPVVIDTRRPHAVIVDPGDGSSFEQSVEVTAECPDLDVVSVQFESSSDGGGSWTAVGPPLAGASPWTVVFAPGAPGTYQVRAIAADALGSDPAPMSVTLTEEDLPPDGPTTLDVVVDGADVQLDWTAVDDPIGDLAGFRVIRNGTDVNAVLLPPDQLTYVDAGLADDFYSYRVAAVDDAGNEGFSPSAWGEVTTPVFEFLEPVTPASSVVLVAHGRVQFEQVELQRRPLGGEFTTVTSFPASDGEVVFPSVHLAPGFNVFRVRGTYDQRHTTRWTRELALVRHDPPAPAEGLDASVAGSDVTISWIAPPDPDVSGYVVSRDGVPLTGGTNPFLFDSGTHVLDASLGTLADWQLVVDGNDGTNWDVGVDSLAPGWWWQWTWDEPIVIGEVRILWRNGARPGELAVELQVDGEWLWWQDYPWVGENELTFDPDLEATGVRLVIPADGWWTSPALAEVGITQRTRLEDVQLVDSGLADGAYLYEVEVANRFGQWADPSEVTAQVGGVALSPPDTLVAAPGACGEIDLTWSPPAPPPAALLAYRLYRGVAGGQPELLVQLASDRLDFTDTGLSDGLDVVYRLTAVADAGGVPVESGPSNDATATVACPPAPAPVLVQPTVAGVPVDWPSDRADIGGRAWPGSFVTLLRNDAYVVSFQIPASAADRLHPLPDLASDPNFGIEDEGRLIAYPLSGDGDGLVIRDLEAGTSTVIGRMSVEWAVVSPEGESVAFIDLLQGEGDDVYIVDVSSGDVRQLTTDGGSKEWLAFDPDGRSFVFVDSDRDEIKRVTVSSGQVDSVHLSQTSDGVLSPAFSGDGRMLSHATLNGIVVQDLTTGVLSPIQPTDAYFSLTRAPMSPDGRYIVWTEYQDDTLDTARLVVRDLVNDEIVPAFAGNVPGFAGSFVDASTVAYLRLGTAKVSTGGDVEVVLRSLADGFERVLSERVSRAALPPRADAADWSLATTPNGDIWILQSGEILQLRRPSGAFTAPDVALQPGTNRFIARQDIDGAILDSEPIELAVAPERFGDAEVVAIGGVPALPITGDTVLIDGTVRNAGQATLEGLVVALTRFDVDGLAHAVRVDTIDLAPGGLHRVREEWSTDGVEGDVHWQLVADPLDAVAEVSEDNNAQVMRIPVRETRGIEASVSTPQSEYPLGEVVPLSIEVTSNDLPSDVLVTTTIETADGQEVDTVDQRTLTAFGYDTRGWQISWPSETVYPGSYRGHVEATRPGAESAEALADFDLVVVSAVEADGRSDRTEYTRGDAAQFTAIVRNLGRAAERNLAVTLRVGPLGGDAVVAETTRSIGALAAGGVHDLSWVWSTAAAPSGMQQLVVSVSSDDGAVLAVSDPVPFLIAPLGADLVGALVVEPASLEPQESMVLSGTITNLGDVALNGTAVAVDIVDVEQGALVSRLNTVVDLPPGVAVPVSWEHVPATARIAAYVAILEVQRLDLPGQEWAPLDSASFDVVDQTPPIVQILDPAPGTVCGTVDIRASVDDLLSEVVAVSFRLDGREPGAPMFLESIEGTVYATSWFVQPDQNGTHVLSVVARDAHGNVGVSTEVEVNIDESPPVLSVNGPEDGTCAVGPAAVYYEATDTDLVALTALLDGVAYASGDPIFDGTHVFAATATDGCGSQASDLRTFIVDSQPPEVSVAGVADGQTYLPPVTIDWSVSDVNLTDAETLLNGSPLDGAGTLVLEEPGDYVLSLRGTDCAGLETSRVVQFTLMSTTMDVIGTLTLDQPAVEPPLSTTASGTVSNRSAFDILGATLTLRLVDPVTSAVLAEVVTTADLLGDQPAQVDGVFDTSDLLWQSYQVQLEAAGVYDGTPFDFVVATADLEIVDWTAPDTTVVTPLPGVVCDPVVVRVLADDALSGVSLVQARVDGAVDLVDLVLVPGQTGDPDLWGLEVPFGSDDGGFHRFEVITIDHAGNVAEPTVLDVEVDVVPPGLDVAAPPDGDCTQGPVELAFTASDLSAVNLGATLNGDAVSSPVAVTADGEYVLMVVAHDACGLESIHQSAFVIDTVPPSIEVVGVEDGAQYQGQVTITWSAVDTSPSELGATLDGAPVEAPLVVDAEGEHLLVVSATDCAGNANETVVAFTIEQIAPLVLGGDVTLSAGLVDQGEPIAAGIVIANEGLEVVTDLTAELRISRVGSTGGSVVVVGLVTLEPGEIRTLDAVIVTDQFAAGLYEVELHAWGEYAGEPYDETLDMDEFEVVVATAIPDLGRFGQLLLALLLAVGGLALLRRQA
jgi:subtilase family serine protease